MLRALCIAVVMAASEAAIAQQSMTLPSIPADKILLKSSADKRIFINVSDDGLAWTELSIAPGEEQFVEVGNGVSEIHVAIRTGDVLWKGKAKPKLRYVLDMSNGIYVINEAK